MCDCQGSSIFVLADSNSVRKIAIDPKDVLVATELADIPMPHINVLRGSVIDTSEVRSQMVKVRVKLDNGIVISSIMPKEAAHNIIDGREVFVKLLLKAVRMVSSVS